jgi:thioredoxin reductase
MLSIQVDVAIIGGSNAGLSAALTLGRSRRSVIVIDDNTPRNAPAGHAHNVYTRDGTPPDELRRIGREQLAPYGVQFLNTRATQVGGSKGAFQLTLANGETLSAARLLLATGVSDDLPNVPGLRELWGKSVFTCPYCHGWEVRDAPLAVLGDGDAGYGYARLIQNWSRDLVLVTGEKTSLTNKQLDDLQARGINVIQANVVSYESQDGELSALHLSDGQRVARQAVFMRPPMSLRGDLLQQLGCTLSPDGLQVVTDEMGQTSVPGVYAAGDIVNRMHSVIVAAASGTKAAAMMNHELVMEAPRLNLKEVVTR